MRRLSAGDIGEVAAAAGFASVTAAGVSVVAAVVSGVGEVTGLSSCGAVDDTADCSSFAGTVGGVSVEARVAASFLPKMLPKMEFLLFGFGAVSRVVEVGVVSATVDSAPAPVVASPAGMTGSPMTRDAMSS